MLEWVAERRCQVGETSFQLSMLVKVESSPQCFWLAKNRPLVEFYARLVEELKPDRILEFGMLDGGSLALLAELGDPDCLVGVDIGEPPSDALERFIRSRGLRVHPYWGTDQADRTAVTAILDQEFDGPIDLVIDDASHLLAPSLTTFNTVFPRLRPGGSYVLEDWGWAHRLAAPPVDVGEFLTQAPLTRMVVEATMTCASRNDIVESVAIDQDTVTIVRGPAHLDADFDLSASYDPGSQPIF